jgi:ATP-dependent Clp protease adaptor protein ClpS
VVNGAMSEYNSEMEEEVISETRDEIDEPPMYKVLLHNDDYTTMEFVVEILMLVFKKSPEESVEIMLNVHQKGIGICGVYTYEVSETKVNTVHALARENGFPLKCTMEEE